MQSAKRAPVRGRRRGRKRIADFPRSPNRDDITRRLAAAASQHEPAAALPFFFRYLAGACVRECTSNHGPPRPLLLPFSNTLHACARTYAVHAYTHYAHAVVINVRGEATIVRIISSPTFYVFIERDTTEGNFREPPRCLIGERARLARIR